LYESMEGPFPERWYCEKIGWGLSKNVSFGVSPLFPPNNKLS